jgi:hypothetical protein
MSITRLPVQHPHAPHCANCKAPLPNFDNANFIMPPFSGDLDQVKLLAVTFHIQCKCGAEWNLKKTCRP